MPRQGGHAEFIFRPTNLHKKLDTKVSPDIMNMYTGQGVALCARAFSTVPFFVRRFKVYPRVNASFSSTSVGVHVKVE